MRIEGSTALVTGASRGLGIAFVEELCERGASKIYAGARDPAALATGILYVLSMAAVIPVHIAPIYSASKAAAMMMALGALTEMKPLGVTVMLSYLGFLDTDMGAMFDYPKAPPRLVAQRSLDAMLEGKASVFPDTYARTAERHLLHQMPRILHNPDQVLNDILTEYLKDPEAGR